MIARTLVKVPQMLFPKTRALMNLPGKSAARPNIEFWYRPLEAFMTITMMSETM